MNISDDYGIFSDVMATPWITTSLLVPSIPTGTGDNVLQVRIEVLVPRDRVLILVSHHLISQLRLSRVWWLVSFRGGILLTLSSVALGLYPQQL
jgi:hypothetical protein